MYGYRSSENGLMANLNSISSSLSSIDTIGRRNNNNSNKASIDNLISNPLRSHSAASRNLLWRSNNNKEYRYATTASIRNGSRCQGSEIYYSGRKSITNFCPTSEAALQFLLVPLLLLTITRQIFDFLGQIWLQILVNFFTIHIIIAALFGIRQKRLSYLVVFVIWTIFNTIWNLLVVFIHSKIREVNISEDALSLFTGSTSWWQSHGPGCLPYNISSIQPSISIIKPNIITGCKLDYHLVEATQAALHASLSFTSLLICCCVVSIIRRSPSYFIKKSPKSDKIYMLNNLTNERSRVNHDPYPSHTSSRLGAHTGSLRRPGNKTSSRSSQHSMASNRSARRKRQQSTGGTSPAPRGSTSSAQRSQKYGSLSSRRSHRRDARGGDISSLTYGTTSAKTTSTQRTRLSSLSSADYLPSYQPPHSSSANLLSSYGEISSIDSYNNNSSNRNGKFRKKTHGNTNPTYTGSRSSINSQSVAANNYDDLSYIYGNNQARTNESVYGASSNATDQSRQRQPQMGHKSRIQRNDYSMRDQPSGTAPEEIQVETYQTRKPSYQLNGGGTITRVKAPMTNGNSFQSFSASNQQNLNRLKLKEPIEINNNDSASNYQEHFDVSDQPNVGSSYNTNSNLRSFENRSRSNTNGSLGISTMTSHQASSQQIYTNHDGARHLIYSNHPPNGNSETPM